MKRVRYLAAALCAAVFLCGFTFPAYAAGEAWESVDPVTERAEVTAEPAVTPSPEPVPTEPAADATASPEPTASPVVTVQPAVTDPAPSQTKAVTLSADAPEEPSSSPSTEDAENEGATGGVDWEGLDDAELAPLTPDGQGTVLDNATDDEGKEFFTVTTADESVFYLIIDRQKSGENVYFLNAVTVADLMALAEDSGETLTPSVTPEPEPEPSTEPEPDQEPEPEQKGGVQIGTLLLALAVVAVGGGAGWYFKIYKPRQQRAAELEEEYEPEPDHGNRYDGLDEWDEAADDLDEEADD